MCLGSAAVPMMYSSVGFYGRDPSMLKGGREKSQFILVNLTGATFSHKPDTICQEGMPQVLCRCCYFLQVTFLLWKQSLVRALRSAVCTGVLPKVVLKSRGCREGCFSCLWISYLGCARADASLARKAIANPLHNMEHGVQHTRCTRRCCL